MELAWIFQNWRATNSNLQNDKPLLPPQKKTAKTMLIMFLFSILLPYKAIFFGCMFGNWQESLKN